MPQHSGSLGVILRSSLLCLALGGCSMASLVGANTDAPPATYDLLAPTKLSASKAYGQWQMVVNVPTAVRALDTDRIVVKSGTQEISYFSGAVWSDKLPRLLHARMDESFENARVLRAVGSGQDRINGDYALSTEIRAFDVVIDGGYATANVSLYVKLIDEKSGQLVASGKFAQRISAGKDDVSAGVVALNQAFSDVSRKLVRWISKRRLAAHNES